MKPLAARALQRASLDRSEHRGISRGELGSILYQTGDFSAATSGEISGGIDMHVPDNISLLPLPRYSPELNPVENIWQFLRQNYLANSVYQTYEAIVDACCDAWNALVAAPETIRSIASRAWAEAVNP